MAYTYEEPVNKKHLTLKKIIINFAIDKGLLRIGRPFWSKFVTVLNYHRIDDPYRKEFDSFKPNISATPAGFARQMNFLSRGFNVVSLRNVIDWLDGRQDLPPYAALITFDDGYLDNYTYAYPILKQYNFPALIFLTTAHIDTDAPFYWDLAAYCFFHTRRDCLKFPDGSELSWATGEELTRVSQAWIQAMKQLPEAEKRTWVSRLPNLLDVSIPHGVFQRLMLTWEQIRDMHKNRIDFGAHTMNHPILTQIPLAEVRNELAGSKIRIEKELRHPVLSFAYPNGLSNDLNPTIEGLVAQTGFRTAFTLFNGPSSRGEIKSNPFAIRRIFISHNHTLSDFVTMVSPLNRYRN